MRINGIVAAMLTSLLLGFFTTACVESPEGEPGTTQDTGAQEDPAAATDEGAIVVDQSPLLGDGPLSPSGQCEDACFAVYLQDCALCSTPSCYDAAAQKYGRCLKDCPH